MNEHLFNFLYLIFASRLMEMRAPTTIGEITIRYSYPLLGYLASTTEFHFHEQSINRKKIDVFPVFRLIIVYEAKKKWRMYNILIDFDWFFLVSAKIVPEVLKTIKSQGCTIQHTSYGRRLNRVQCIHAVVNTHIQYFGGNVWEKDSSTRKG